MELLTKVDIPPSDFTLSHQDKILMLGSCFIENIGNLLLKNKFSIHLNPFGIVYNPQSIAQTLDFILGEKQFTQDDLFHDKGLFHSFYHHSRFSDVDEKNCFENIQSHITEARNYLKDSSAIIITFGTAYKYTHKSRNIVVGNCHKLPASDFDRTLMSIDEIVEVWQQTLNKLIATHPKIKLLFTVSPIRHFKDGAHGNQLSKASLLLAIDRLIGQFDAAQYFPSYEIVLDELRDYRFYNDDMTHPSPKAIEYIWERFANIYFSDETNKTIAEWNKLASALSHRPFNEASDEHQLFLKQTRLKIETFAAKYPFISCAKEIQEITDRLI